MHTTSTTPVLIFMAIGLVAFGGVVLWRESRVGRRREAIGFLFGFPAICLCAVAALENVRWLYIPGLILLCCSYAARIWYTRHARSTAVEYSNGTDEQ